MVVSRDREFGEMKLGSQGEDTSNNRRILAHRGLWSLPEEQNTLLALSAALEHGFGIETDVRDSAGELVVSHDVPVGGEVKLTELYRLIQTRSSAPPIALNIKSDGLAKEISRAFPQENDSFSNTFYFDMSLPQYIQYSRLDLPVAIRLSEYERVEPLEGLLERQPKKWVWLDAFNGDWWLDSEILADSSYAFVVVSPELHGRPHLSVWQTVKAAIANGQDVYICTDFPIEFSRYLDAD